MAQDFSRAKSKMRPSLQILTGDDFLLAGIGVDAAGDDAVGDVFEVLLEDLAQLHELGPEGVIDEAFWHADHDGIAPLAGVTVGAQVITAQQGHDYITLCYLLDPVVTRILTTEDGLEFLLHDPRIVGPGVVLNLASVETSIRDRFFEYIEGTE
jgi:hypothetical protein